MALALLALAFLVYLAVKRDSNTLELRATSILTAALGAGLGATCSFRSDQHVHLVVDFTQGYAYNRGACQKELKWFGV